MVRSNQNILRHPSKQFLTRLKVFFGENRIAIIFATSNEANYTYTSSSFLTQGVGFVVCCVPTNTRAYFNGKPFFIASGYRRLKIKAIKFSP